jgi:hypothetical protein
MLIKEEYIPDGIGAQLLRKIVVKSYADATGAEYYNEPIKDFLIHESDKINTEDEKNKIIEQFNNLISHTNPKDMISNIKEISTNEINSSMLTNFNFLNIETVKENRVVIHIRRGNVIPTNPRWIDEERYVELVDNIDNISKLFSLENPEIFILTDSPVNSNKFKPYDKQDDYWKQEHLVADSNGEYPLTSINPDNFPNVKIINNMGTYESFLFMLNSAVIVPSWSAFSRAASLLTKNSYVDIFGVLG